MEGDLFVSGLVNVVVLYCSEGELVGGVGRCGL